MLVAIDSDGCAIDVMEAKHRLCFTPATIAVWRLEAIAKEVRATTEAINLYSIHRGLNRFAALLLTFERLAANTAVQASRVPLPDMDPLRKLVRAGVTALGPIREHATDGPGLLQEVVQWSERINEEVERLILPRLFDGVEAFLREVQPQARIAVVSSAATETLEREWQACGVRSLVDDIYGQEHGSKEAILRELAGPATVLLMIGDAPGDARAAAAAGYAFYPILPRQEAESWQKLRARYWTQLLNGRYLDQDEPALRRAFTTALPPLSL